MTSEFYRRNRTNLLSKLPEGALVLLFSGFAPRKRADENYPFFADRNFVYLTGIDRDADIIYLARKTGDSFSETLFILPSDLLIERWNGRRTKPDEAHAISGIEDVRYVADFDTVFRAGLGNCSSLWLDLDGTRDPRNLTAAEHFAMTFADRFAVSGIAPEIKNLRPALSELRLIKADCEIEAMRRAIEITGDGIRAMMRGVKDGMREYEIKHLYDTALLANGCLEPGFPSIISAGGNNFCIHYYAYSGTAHNGDLVLCDVGGCYDHIGCDISRAFPVNGRFSERQRLLYEVAYAVSERLFSEIKPGFPMEDVDGLAKRYCFERLRDLGILGDFSEIGKLMWHGGSHHVGFDTHDVVLRPKTVAPGMVFCVDIGIYYEEWGIGFRLEDNCLVTDSGCENLSRAVPREIDDIEAQRK